MTRKLNIKRARVILFDFFWKEDRDFVSEVRLILMKNHITYGDGSSNAILSGMLDPLICEYLEIYEHFRV